MKKTLEKIYVVIVIVVVLASMIVTTQLTDLDEIWNYNFARNVANGLLPYKDFNMIQMPLLPNLCAVFLLILGKELVVMRILAIILCAAILLLSNKILKRLNVNKQIGYLFLVGVIYLFKNQFRIDYNFFVLFNLLAIIYLELKNKVNSKASKIDILSGVLAGICICTKQTIGILISLALVIYPLFNVTKKEEFKQYFKKVLYRVIGIVIPLLLLAVYFTIFGLWKEFISYCVLGIKTFSNTIPYTNLLKSKDIVIKALSILAPVFLIVSFVVCVIKRKDEKEVYKNLSVITLYGIVEMAVVFPISDDIHFLLGIFPTLIGLVYIFNILIRQIKLQKVKILTKEIKLQKVKIFAKEFLKIAIFLASIIIVINAGRTLYQYISVANQYTQMNHFKYIPNTRRTIRTNATDR